MSHKQALEQLSPIKFSGAEDADLQFAGDAYDALDERNDALLESFRPSGGDETLIAGWEKEFGIIPPPTSTLEARRAAVAAAFTARGGLSQAYFIQLAAAFGIEVEIEDMRPLECGLGTCGDIMWDPRIWTSWLVKVLNHGVSPVEFYRRLGRPLAIHGTSKFHSPALASSTAPRFMRAQDIPEEMTGTAAPYVSQVVRENPAIVGVKLEDLTHEVAVGPGADYVSEIELLSEDPRYHKITPEPGILRYDSISDGSARRNCIAFGADLYVEVGEGGLIRTSPTAAPGSWTVRGAGLTSEMLNFVLRVEVWGLFLAAGQNGAFLFSADGITWTVGSAGSAANISSIAFSPQLGVAMLVAGGSAVRVSSDGTTWTSPSTMGVDSTNNSVIWVPARSRWYVAKSTSGGNMHVFRSMDGNTWGDETIAGTDNLFSIVALGARLIVAGSNGRIMTSDTIGEWTIRSSGTTESLRLFEGNGVVQAVGNNGASRQSLDGGATWVAGAAVGTTAFNRFGMTDPNDPRRALVVGDGGTALRGVYPFRALAYGSDADRSAIPIPMSWWDFDADHITGATVLDLGGFGRAGTIVGSPTFEAGPAGSRAIVFSGAAAGRVDNANVPSPGMRDFSGAIWFKTVFSGGGSQDNGMLFKRSTSTSDSSGYSLSCPNGVVRFRVADGSSFIEFTSGGVWNDGQWHLAVFTVQRGVAYRIYVDGVERANRTTGLPTGPIGGPTFQIGSGSGGDYHRFAGSLASPRIYYGMVLSAGEVAAMYARESAGGSYAPLGAAVTAYSDQPTTITMADLISMQLTGITPALVGTGLAFDVATVSTGRLTALAYDEDEVDVATVEVEYSDTPSRVTIPEAIEFDLLSPLAATDLPLAFEIVQLAGTFSLRAFSSDETRAAEEDPVHAIIEAYADQPTALDLGGEVCLDSLALSVADMPIDFEVVGAAPGDPLPVSIDADGFYWRWDSIDWAGYSGLSNLVKEFHRLAPPGAVPMFAYQPPPS